MKYTWIIILAALIFAGCMPEETEPIDENNTSNVVLEKKGIDITSVRGYVTENIYRIEVLMKLSEDSQKIDMKSFNVSFNDNTFTYPDYEISLQEGNGDEMLETNEIFLIRFDPKPFDMGENWNLSIKGDGFTANAQGNAPINETVSRLEIWP